MNGADKPSSWDSKQRRGSTRKTLAMTPRKQRPPRRKANCPAECATATTLPTNRWGVVHFLLTTPLTCGAQAAMKCEKGEFACANPATASGRRKTRTTTCIDVHFHSQMKGVEKKPVPPVFHLPHEPANSCTKPNHKGRHTSRHERRFDRMETA